jgi:hypothetical protein
MIHSLGSMVDSFNETRTIEWITQHVDENPVEYDVAHNFTQTAREYHKTNDRFRKLWFFNPWFEWMPDQYMDVDGPIRFRDKTVVITALSVRKSGGAALLDDESRRVFHLLPVAPFVVGDLVSSIAENAFVTIFFFGPGENSVGLPNPYANDAIRGSSYNRNPDGSYLTGYRCPPPVD